MSLFQFRHGGAWRSEKIDGPGCPPRQTVVTAWGVGAAHLALRGCEFFFVAINYVDEETHVKRLFLSILALLAFSRVVF